MKITPISHTSIDTQTANSEILNLKKLDKFYCFYSAEYDPIFGIILKSIHNQTITTVK